MAQTYLNFSYPLSTSLFQEHQDAMINIMDTVMVCGLLPLFSVCGLLINVLNILILSKYGLHETSSLLLFSLSVCYMISSFLQLFPRLPSIVALFDPLLAMSFESIFGAYIATILGYFIAMTKIHMTIIAVERLVAVCFPLKMSWVFTPSHVKLMLGFVYFYVFVLLLPTAFLIEMSWTFDPSTNRTFGALTPTTFYKRDFNSINQYMYLGLLSILGTLPFVTTLSAPSSLDTR
ncbi:thyrotropin-releasing hormone receptor [Biomphalaria glabrata]|nr:thyrotropin-releasing hormone receptor-like [Biomphalaria glabrata]